MTAYNLRNIPELQDFWDVGPNKPIASLAEWQVLKALHAYSETIGLDAPLTITDLWHELQAHGLNGCRFPKHKVTIAGIPNVEPHLETVYVYDKASLQAFLDEPEHKAILNEYRWPTGASDFVHRLSHEVAMSDTSLYELIREAYGNRNPYHRNAAETLSVYSSVFRESMTPVEVARQMQTLVRGTRDEERFAGLIEIAERL